jgi:hypothetical protein
MRCRLKRMTELGSEPIGGSSQDIGSFIIEDIER